MFALDGQSRIFVFCPSGAVTGGPESLHLLVSTLRRRGRDARIVYRPAPDAPTPREYAGYEIVTADAAESRPNNVLILPEVWAATAGKLAGADVMQTAIWWLSVDNYQAHDPFDFAAPRAREVRHMVGSAYAESFVRGQGATAVAHLSSYVHERFATVTAETRADRVLYNPKKGMAVVARLMAALPDVEWRALDGLGRDEVAELMARSKVYVDFGHHPGKERLPREAALAGLCVVTGRKGSAAFDADVPIARAYKLDDREPLDDARLLLMAATIRACVREFATRQAHFAAYRDEVRGEKARFERDLARLFG